MSANETPEKREGYKRAAALAALDHIRPHMKVGLGTGTTANYFIQALGARIREDRLPVQAVSTSRATTLLAEQVSIPLISLDTAMYLDIMIDGVDEITPELSAIKGGGGALLYEKIVARAAHRLIFIADTRKCVAELGHFPLPVEVIPFGFEVTCGEIEQVLVQQGLSGTVSLRLAPIDDIPSEDKKAFMTQSGHYTVDISLKTYLKGNDHLQALSAALLTIPGVVEHGLFLSMADCAYIAGAGGVQRYLSGGMHA